MLGIADAGTAMPLSAADDDTNRESFHETGRVSSDDHGNLL
jgi:hypothetical protein